MTKFFAFFKTASRAIVLVLALLSLFSATVKAGSFDDWFIAAKNDQPGKIRELLRQGFDPNAIEPKRGDTGLILAMRENALEVMAVLLADRRTKIDAEAFNGDNALMIDVALKSHFVGG